MIEELIQKEINFKRKQGVYRLRFETLVDFDDIKEGVLKITNVKEEELMSRSRKTDTVIARQLIYYYAFFLTSLTVKDIGILLDRDHTSVLHGRDIIIDLNDVRDDSVWYLIKDLNTQFNERVIPIGAAV